MARRTGGRATTSPIERSILILAASGAARGPRPAEVDPTLQRGSCWPAAHDGCPQGEVDAGRLLDACQRALKNLDHRRVIRRAAREHGEIEIL